MPYLLFLFGLLLGSFLNVLIYRLPRGKGVVLGRSRCLDCRSALAWYDLIPIISWLILRARCRQCRTTISWQYPLVELASGLIFVLGGSVFTIFLLEIFLVLFVIDLRYLILPDSVILLGLLGALTFSRLGILTYPNVLTALGLGLFFFLLWWWSRGTWLGLGDAKLALLIGLVFGPWLALAVIYSGIGLGALVALGLLVTRRAGWRTKLPLGSFICLAAVFYLLWGDVIIKSRWFALLTHLGY